MKGGLNWDFIVCLRSHCNVNWTKGDQKAKFEIDEPALRLQRLQPCLVFATTSTNGRNWSELMMHMAQTWHSHGTVTHVWRMCDALAWRHFLIVPTPEIWNGIMNHMEPIKSHKVCRYAVSVRLKCLFFRRVLDQVTAFEETYESMQISFSSHRVMHQLLRNYSDFLNLFLFPYLHYP